MPRLSSFARPAHPSGGGAPSPSLSALSSSPSFAPAPSAAPSQPQAQAPPAAAPPPAGAGAQPLHPPLLVRPSPPPQQQPPQQSAAPQHAPPRARVYRWADGSLRPERPPPEPYTVAARRSWAELVHHCRVTGGDADSGAGRSLRYGIGCTWAEHASYLESIGLAPERTAAGEWIGYDPTKEDPLSDPDHPLRMLEAAAAARAAVA